MAKRKVTKSELSAHGSKNKGSSEMSIDVYQNHDLAQPVNPIAIAEQALKRIKDNLRKNLKINQKSKQLVTYSQSIAQKIQW
jgi:hypothetical protein